MKQFEQVVGGLLVGGFVIILIADVLKQVIWYLVVFMFLAVIFRLVLRDR